VTSTPEETEVVEQVFNTLLDLLGGVLSIVKNREWRREGKVRIKVRVKS
jgi:hypothetical protein